MGSLHHDPLQLVGRGVCVAVDEYGDSLEDAPSLVAVGLLDLVRVELLLELLLLGVHVAAPFLEAVEVPFSLPPPRASPRHHVISLL